MSEYKLCGRCYSEVSELFPSKCKEKPELLIYNPIGMYHCPDCGCMLLAGVTHVEICKSCLNELTNER